MPGSLGHPFLSCVLYAHVTAVEANQHSLQSPNKGKSYTLHQKKVTFNLSICPGASGSLTLTDGLDDSVKWSWEHSG